LIKDFIKADLHVDTFSMDIQNIILYNVKFKYYPYVYAYTHAIWSCRHNSIWTIISVQINTSGFHFFPSR
jgi:hypothetical protein